MKNERIQRLSFGLKMWKHLSIISNLFDWRWEPAEFSSHEKVWQQVLCMKTSVSARLWKVTVPGRLSGGYCGCGIQEMTGLGSDGRDSREVCEVWPLVDILLGNPYSLWSFRLIIKLAILALFSPVFCQESLHMEDYLPMSMWGVSRARGNIIQSWQGRTGRLPPESEAQVKFSPGRAQAQAASHKTCRVSRKCEVTRSQIRNQAIRGW